MTGLAKRYTDSRSRRQQRAFVRWAETREKGKTRYVLRQAVIFPVMMTVFYDFWGYMFDGGVPILRIRFIVWWFVMGLITGSSGWSTREGKYMKALTAHRQVFRDNKIVHR